MGQRRSLGRGSVVLPKKQPVQPSEGKKEGGRAREYKRKQVEGGERTTKYPWEKNRCMFLSSTSIHPHWSGSSLTNNAVPHWVESRVICDTTRDDGCLEDSNSTKKQ